MSCLCFMSVELVPGGFAVVDGERHSAAPVPRCRIVLHSRASFELVHCASGVSVTYGLDLGLLE